MYSVLEGLDQGVQYNSSTSFLHNPTLTTSASILNLSAEYNHHPGPDQQQQQQQPYDVAGEYKVEPATPTPFPAYPTTYTPSPSSSGCESPGTPGFNYFPCSLNDSSGTATSERLVVPFPAPTPPLSATLHAKEVEHSLSDTDRKSGQCSFSSEQIDCICDNLHNRGDFRTLGR